MARATKILLFRNGDEHFPAKTIVIDSKSQKGGEQGVDHFLDFINPKFQPYGSLERMFNMDGSRVRALGDLVDGGKYVVGKKEKFRPVLYDGIVPDAIRQRDVRKAGDAMVLANRGMIMPPALPPVRKRVVVSTGNIQASLGASAPRKIFLLRNGDSSLKPFTLVLNGRNAMTMDQVCQRVSNKLDLRHPCRSLFTIMGSQITNVPDLETAKTYVAVSRRGFQHVGYQPVEPPKRLQRGRAGPKFRKRGVVKVPPAVLPSLTKPSPKPSRLGQNFSQILCAAAERDSNSGPSCFPRAANSNAIVARPWPLNPPTLPIAGAQIADRSGPF